MSNSNLIEMRLPTGAYGSNETTQLLRAYPAGGVAGPARPEFSSGSSGSGFFVARSLIATNFHVVENAGEITVTIAGDAVRAEMILRDAQNDLAILRVPAVARSPLGPECLRIGSASAVRAGDRAFALGYPLAGLLASSINVSEGIVNNVVGIQDDPRLFQISIPIQPGSSGSPLINTRGEVIGVVTSTLNNRYLFERAGTMPQNVNFAVKASYLANLLQLLPEATCEIIGAIDLSARDIQERLSTAVVPVRAMR
jgi:S1-C subfamily serine protease